MSTLTAEEMQKILCQHHVNVPANASYRDLMLLYEDVIDWQMTECFSIAASTVSFPCHPSSFF